MATFVLVHGAWFGGWCWQKVVSLLEAGGHEVYAPTHTGLAERASELSPEVGLDTHIQDIVGLLEELFFARTADPSATSRERRGRMKLSGSSGGAWRSGGQGEQPLGQGPDSVLGGPAGQGLLDY